VRLYPVGETDRADARLRTHYAVAYGALMAVAGAVVGASATSVILFLPHRFAVRRIRATPVIDECVHHCGADCACTDTTLSAVQRRDARLLHPDWGRRFKSQPVFEGAPKSTLSVSTAAERLRNSQRASGNLP